MKTKFLFFLTNSVDFDCASVAIPGLFDEALFDPNASESQNTKELILKFRGTRANAEISLFLKSNLATLNRQNFSAGLNLKLLKGMAISATQWSAYRFVAENQT